MDKLRIIRFTAILCGTFTVMSSIYSMVTLTTPIPSTVLMLLTVCLGLIYKKLKNKKPQ